MNETAVGVLPAYNEIPDVGLYLDQVSKYINQSMEKLPGKTITNSMISNYVKHDLVPNPIKKLYYRDQIAKLIFIAVSKSALSLGDIDFIFQLTDNYLSVKEAYTYFADTLSRGLSGEIITDDNEGIFFRALNQTVRTLSAQITLEKLINETRGAEDLPEYNGKKKKKK